MSLRWQQERWHTIFENELSWRYDNSGYDALMLFVYVDKSAIEIDLFFYFGIEMNRYMKHILCILMANRFFLIWHSAPVVLRIPLEIRDLLITITIRCHRRFHRRARLEAALNHAMLKYIILASWHEDMILNTLDLKSLHTPLLSPQMRLEGPFLQNF